MAAIVALASVMACEREADSLVDAPASSGGSHAYIVAPTDTRTDFDSYVGKFAWSEGDQIAIHLSDGTFYATEVNAETGAFACSTTPSKKRDAYAIYPAAAADADNYGSPTLNVVLPAEYDISANLSSDYSPVPMIAVNRQAEDDLYFRHVGGLLRITCDRVPVGTRYIAVTADRNIAGTFTVTNPASENPTISTGGNAQTVTFRVAETSLSQLTDGIVLNLPVPVGPVATLKVAALNASGAELYSDTRDINIDIARYSGKKCAYSMTEVFVDSMQMVVRAGDDTAWTFTMPFNQRYHASVTFPARLRIFWGDGSWSEVESGSYYGNVLDQISHTYSTPGDFTITIEAEAKRKNDAMLPGFNMYIIGQPSVDQYLKDSRKMLKAVPTAVLSSQSGIYFEECTALESINEDLFAKNPSMDFARTFVGCRSLSGSIPAKLFANNRWATSFSDTFQGCSSLTGSIPEELFANCPNVTSISHTFHGCSGLTGSIPAGLFANNPLVRFFSYVFTGCSGLNGYIPEDLFANNQAVESFMGLFNGCSGLTGPIPAGLFSHCPLATDFRNVFSSCSGLKGSIPANLFAACTDATSFGGTFSDCSGLTGSIPADLFAHNPLANECGALFSGCSGLTGGIPGTLLSYCPDVTGVASLFNGCSGLTGGIPENLFANQSKITSFHYVFRNCSGLSGTIPADLFATNPDATSFEQTFCGCTHLTGAIPATLFSRQDKVTSFAYTFAGSGVTGAIPASLFATNPLVTGFGGTFSGCAGLTTIPSGLFGQHTKVISFASLFYDCTGLTCNIPAELFDNCPEVTDFHSLFENCSGLTGSIPHGFFSNNLKASAYYQAFRGCSNLLLVPDIFIVEGSESTPENRFANLSVQFTSCFAGVGGGTAPPIWTYQYRQIFCTACFRNSSNLTNWNDINPGWK